MIFFKLNPDKQNYGQDLSRYHLSLRHYCLSPYGFSLVEVLIAMVIFSIGILGVAKMQVSATGGNSSARVVTDSVVQASDQIEKLLLLPYDHADLAAGHHTGAALPGYTLFWDVKDDFPVQGNKKVAVTITPAGMFNGRNYTIEFIKSEIH